MTDLHGLSAGESAVRLVHGEVADAVRDIMDWLMSRGYSVRWE